MAYSRIGISGISAKRSCGSGNICHHTLLLLFIVIFWQIRFSQETVFRLVDVFWLY
jgi:hypothetical protein